MRPVRGKRNIIEGNMLISMSALDGCPFLQHVVRLDCSILVSKSKLLPRILLLTVYMVLDSLVVAIVH